MSEQNLRVAQKQVMTLAWITILYALVSDTLFLFLFGPQGLLFTLIAFMYFAGGAAFYFVHIIKRINESKNLIRVSLLFGVFAWLFAILLTAVFIL